MKAQIGHDALTLLDEQLLADEVVWQAVEESRRSNKRVVAKGVGNAQLILDAAADGETDAIEIDRDAQFRCGGSKVDVE